METHEQSSTLRALSTPELLGPDGVPGLFHHLDEMFSQIARAGRASVGPIKGYSSLIQDDNEYDSNSAWWARKIERNANDFNDYLVHLGMLRLRDAVGLMETTFDDLLKFVISRLTPSLTRLPKVEIADTVPRPFLQYNDLVARIIYHVVRNAAEAAKERVLIRVSEQSVADGHRIGREFTICVTDDGPGIARLSRKLVWEPFFTTRQDHLGLGLPYIIAASAVVDMSVDLKNIPSGGAMMTLVFRDKGDQE